MKKRVHASSNRTTILIAGFFIAFFALALFSLFTYRTQTQKFVLQSDIEQLTKIFTRIDETAGIQSFDFDHNWINFLHIHTQGFSGSEVGSLNLRHPDRWEGPYVENNLTYQGIEYQVVKTAQGLYIVPGPGTQLPNGKIMGSDVVIDAETEITSLLVPGGALEYKGAIFAAPLDVVTRDQNEDIAQVFFNEN